MTYFAHPTSLWDHFDVAMVRNFPNFQTWGGFATAPGYKAVQLGAGYKKISGWDNLDYPEWDAEDQTGNKWRLPYADEEVWEVATYHTLDHLSPEAVVRTLAEVQRILKPKGFITIVVPHHTSTLWNECLFHKSRFAIDTWRNIFSERQYSHASDTGVLPDWKFKIGFNMIMGLVERNLVQVTQLIKED